MITKLSLAALVALAASLPAPLSAAGESAYTDLVEALAAKDRLMSGFADSAIAVMVGEARRDPEMVEMEEECAGTLDLMGQTARPHLVASHERGVTQYRAQLLELFSSRLSPEEARGAAEFYASDDGRFLISLAEQNESVENVLSDVRGNEDGSVSAAALAADKAVMEEKIRKGGDRTRLAKIGWFLMTADWFRNFQTLKSEMHQLELALVNDDFTAEEGAAFDAALEEAFTAHFEACYAD
ncbi:hypothetical protein [Qipengyuania soli]|uniref:DUF2059 domain-containing protein n=1 Tax=Qipengyuania soli TaxID=2782568 RepID=A0A7S8F2A5_9SPHN|nr:hypothetical protein [Qipengyuania soli]QPC99200.1 hypothetical protein IRL76_01040 [Qipengyuania soli]